MNVVKEQVGRSLLARPVSFAKFQEEVGKYSYAEIQRIRQRERLAREQSEFQAQPIMYDQLTSALANPCLTD